MQAKMTLLLKGGHRVDIACDDGDPVVMGLISALPGATLDPALPSDGVIQVDSPSAGQRLFIARKSLVGVDLHLSKFAEASKSKLIDSSIVPAASIPEGGTAPTPAVLLPNLLNAEDLAAALGVAVADGGVPDLVRAAIEQGVRRTRTSLGVPDFLTTQLRLDVEPLPSIVTRPLPGLDTDPDQALARALVCLLVLARSDEPASLLRLHDREMGHGCWMRGPECRVFTLPPNTLAIVPGNAHYDFEGTSGRLVAGILEANLSTL